MPGLLEGIRVVDATRHFPGPYCTLALADLGAEVIKVEPPGTGDPLRLSPPYHEGEAIMFGAFNRSKQSLCCDLKLPGGQAVVQRLVQTADVFIESFRPGVASRLGLGPEALRDADERLIYCSLTGYGQHGPLASMAGHDLNFQSLSGILERSGSADGPPAMPGQPLADLAAGGLVALSAILAALVARPQQGGRYLDVAMLDGMLSFQAMAACETAAGDPSSREQTMLTGMLPCYRIYPTSDAKYVAFAALEEKFWRAFLEAVERPELEDLQYDDEPEAIQQIAELFAQTDRATWEDLGRRVDCCLTPVLTSAEAMAHPQVQARKTVLAGQPLGIRFPVQFDPPGLSEPRLPPQLGAQSQYLLESLGFTSEERRDLLDSGAVQ